MAEPRRFQFDSNQRSVGVPTRGRGVWLWIAVSLALHGALVLFALVGTARGGHSELAGTFEVTVVGPPSAGEPDGGAKTEKNDAPEAEAAPRKPDAPPEKTPPTPALPQPAYAPPPAPAPPNTTPPPEMPKPVAKPQPADAPDPIALPRKAASAESESTEPRPDSAAAPKRPDMARQPEPMAPPRETTDADAPPRAPQSPTAETAPKRPEAPVAPATPTVARPRAAREPPAAPKAAANTAPRGVKKAPEGQTASLGTPNGGERLGRSDSDDTGGMLNVNLNPRFRAPPPPTYPRQSIERDEEGVVLVRALVDPVGAPQRVLIFKSSGFPLLDEAALIAVQKWRFEPMIREGRAAAAWVQVPVRFRLN